MRVACALLLSLAACTDEVIVEPVIDSPIDDPDATAFPLDELTLAIAHAGDTRDLVTGRFGSGDTVELPGAPFGDDLVMHIEGFRGATSAAYGRTCMFRVDPSLAAPQPHLFFSRNQKFATIDAMSISRIGGHAISIDGSAIIVGGLVNGAPVADVAYFDPRTGELSTPGAVRDRVDAVLALLGTSPARVVVVGGRSGTEGAAFVELIDPRRAVERIDDGHMARVGLSATSLTDGRVIAIGGNAPGAAPVGTITTLVVSGAGVEVRDLRAALAFPRTGHTATRLGDDVGAPVLIAGGTTGVDGTGPTVAIAELFKPLAEELARPATFAPGMVVPRSHHTAALMPDGTVMIIGGLDAAGNQVRTLERFSIDSGFVVVGEMPETAAVLDNTVTTLPDGRLLIAGGRNAVGGAPVNTAFIVRLDPLDGSVDVVPTDRLAVARAGHQAALLCDGTVLVSGGTEEPAYLERYNPPPVGRR